MSQRYTAGGAGRFTFAELNALKDKADRAEARQPIEGSFRGPRIEPFWARLGAQLPEQAFEDGPNAAPRPIFEWVQVIAKAAPTKRKIEEKPRAPKSSLFKPSPKGRAVLLSGSAKPGDIVMLHPLIATKGERWFAFSGSPLGQSSLLRIDEAVIITPDRRWRYYVTPVRFNQFGSLLPNIEADDGIAFNTFEIENEDTEWGHGQDLEFPGNPPPGLQPLRAVTGIVHGILTQKAKVLDDGTFIPSVYGFEAPVPLAPDCSAGIASPAALAALNPETFIASLLSEGVT